MKIIIYEEEPSWLIMPIKTTMPFAPINPTLPLTTNFNEFSRVAWT